MKSMHEQWTVIARHISRIMGSEASFGIDEQLFNMTAAASIAIGGLAIIYIALLSNPILLSTLIVSECLFIGVYYLARHKHKVQQALLIYSAWIMLLLNFMWLVNDGVSGSTPYFVVIIIAVTLFVAKQPLYYLAGIVINLFILMLSESYLADFITFTMPHSQLWSFLSLLLCVAYLAFLSLYFKQFLTRGLGDEFFEAMKQVHMESETVNHTADTISGMAGMLKNASQLQKTAVEELNKTAEEVGKAAQKNQNLASHAVDAIKETELHLSTSRATINKLVFKMGEMKTSSENIQRINNVIEELSSQTNILSLNAMIEAARLGEEQGGFKIVALEVKKLAERSAQAAEDINALLDENFQSVKSSVNLTESMKERFNDISDRIQPLSNQVQQVSDASIEQNSAIGSIQHGLNNIDRHIGSNQNVVEGAFDAVTELRNNASSLQRVVKSLYKMFDE